jgi:hypothetical protein
VLSAYHTFGGGSLTTPLTPHAQPALPGMQGPPGTGKSDVVVSILNVAHMVTYDGHMKALSSSLVSQVISGEQPPITGSRRSDGSRRGRGVIIDRCPTLAAASYVREIPSLCSCLVPGAWCSF